MHSETLIADPFKSTKEKKEKCRKKDARLPLAHLPISTSNDFSTSKYYAVNCDTFLQIQSSINILHDTILLSVS